MFYAYKKIKQHRQKKAAAAEAVAKNGSLPLSQHESQMTVKAPPSPEQVADKKRRRIYRWKLVAGLFGPFALQALDTTIIASALSNIATEFDQFKQLNWIISSFNLTSAAFLFFWAQMADIFGRHVTIQAAIVTMVIGSAICTGAPTSSFPLLLFGRSVQGIGCSGVNMVVRTILADRVSLSEFSVNWTIFVLISGVSFGIGPLIGGYLTKVSWRWCFGINLPIGAVSIILVAFLLRKDLIGPQPLPELGGDTQSRRGRLLIRVSTIDFTGQLLFLWGLGLLLLAFTWAGSTYSWNSAAVLAPLVIGAALTVAWVWFERSMTPGRAMSRFFSKQRPMMPWEIISQKDNCLVFLINFVAGMAMFAAMYFMDLYFTQVEGKSNSDAGIGLLFYMPGLVVGIYMASLATGKWPRQTLPPLILGAITTAVGITVLAYAVHIRNISLVYGMLALTGHGVAQRMNPASLHCLGYFPNRTTQITCLTAFALPFGGMVGLTIMTTVFNNKIGAQSTPDPKDGIMWAFIAMIPFMWVCVLLALCLGNVWILKDGNHEIIRGSYLWKLITKQRVEKERQYRGEVEFEDRSKAKSQNGEVNC